VVNLDETSSGRPLRRHISGVAFGIALLTVCAVVDLVPNAARAAPSSGASSVAAFKVQLACQNASLSAGLLAITSSGDLVAVNSNTFRTRVIAHGILAHDGVAVRPELDSAYVTAPGPGAKPAIWQVSLTSCHARPKLVETAAELPSVSPDGGLLGFVTLDQNTRQTGAAIVRLGPTGRPISDRQLFPAKTTPPPLAIFGIAVGKDADSLAVWGGFVDPYLGRKHRTVGTLDPSKATSLRALTAVFDEQGISDPGGSAKPEAWQSAPAYLANGEFLVSNNHEIVMPYTDMTPGEIGGGIRNIESTASAIRSIAVGSGGTLVWVDTSGRLTLAPNVINLPFGPGADTPPTTTAPTEHVIKGMYTSVAWTAGLSAQSTAPPPVFHIVAHLPSVVGLAEPQAAEVMAALDLPVFIGHTVIDHSVPADTVIAQDPPAGDGVACQCTVVFTISSTS
jgi:hypothetical protein